MPILKYKGISFNYEIEGEGAPILFLHGLGGNLEQPRSLIGELDGYQRIYLDCRTHGKTFPVGQESFLNFDRFADDVVNLFDMLRIEYPILGGVSMGAGISANIAVRYPGFVQALVLIRPAWMDKPNPSNLAIFPKIAHLLRELGTRDGKRKFILSDEYQVMRERYPAVAESLVSQFDDLLAVERCARLERMTSSCPVTSMAECLKIKCPTLVIVTDSDPVHPLEYGRIWADAIPSAEFIQIPSKSVDASGHVCEFRKVLGDFLQRNS